MSWQNTWGTVKSTNAKACALYHEVSNVGKMVEASKKRVTWRLRVEEGKEYEITLTHSIASGKKVLRVDGIVKYTAKAMSFGDWDYVFNLPGGHVVHIIIKPSVDLNDMYDLIIDNISFRRLPDRTDNGISRPKSYSTPSYTNQGYNSKPYNSSRENSFSKEPWECPHCTLVNEKPLAPICEACGNPRPITATSRSSHRPSMETRERSLPPAAPAPLNRSQSVQSSNRPKVPASTDFFGSDPFGSDNSTAQSNAFDPFGPGSTTSFGANSTSTPSTSTTFTPPSLPAQDSLSMLSGLDFTAPATEMPVSPSAYQDFTQPLPIPSTEETSDRHSSGDLWESKMVDLNLNPKAKPKSTSIKAQQTLEQARATASTKEKTPIMPVIPITPTPQYYAPQATLAAPAGFYQGNTMNHGFNGGNHAMVPYGLNPMGTMNMHMNTHPNVFITTGSSFNPPAKPFPIHHSNDPFATLS